MLADSSSREALLETLDQLAAHARDIQAQMVAVGRAYAARQNRFPDRAHVSVLAGRLVHDYADMPERWARWAKAEVATWPSTGPDTASHAGNALTDTLGKYDRR